MYSHSKQTSGPFLFRFLKQNSFLLRLYKRCYFIIKEGRNKKMITEVLNNNLIEAMRIRIPDGTNLANVLMDILYIGKEAVYRRLRGGSSLHIGRSGSYIKKLRCFIRPDYRNQLCKHSNVQSEFSTLFGAITDLFIHDPALC